MFSTIKILAISFYRCQLNNVFFLLWILWTPCTRFIPAGKSRIIVQPIHIPCCCGWLVQNCTYPGRGVCDVLPWNPPIGEILVLVPRFDRELHKHSLAAKMAPGLNSTLFARKASVSKNKHLENELHRKDR